ncbi:MAG TPA: class I SAM-dependent methyltransferase [Planctomycetaceae bacterium]|jgi:2-polyprenyl-3-methyl-5-hydroxy-6-metoxy-1,4-benzoquinol methylase|nr:class I SAM-dependent methyltransferase [Planctomycetaceae bacterium]
MTLAQNRAAWNRMAETGSVFATVATDDECRNPLAALDSRGWLPPTVMGLDVLCLASGGGWQSILYACAGAKVTVVDLSQSMLRLDEREAARRNRTVRTIEGSMHDLSMLGAATLRSRASAGQHLLRTQPEAGFRRNRPRAAFGRALHQST